MIGRHDYKAEWIEGRGLIVTDPSGAEVKVSYGATVDTRTCYAYTADGFIGGWQCLPKRSRPDFRDLVGAINAGRLYRDMNDLPGGRGRGRRRP